MASEYFVPKKKMWPTSMPRAVSAVLGRHLALEARGIVLLVGRGIFAGEGLDHRRARSLS